MPEDWKEKLTPEEYYILREKGTERAFTGKYHDHKETGTYACAGCGAPLFSSEAKYDSGSGWPSFFTPIAEKNIICEEDSTNRIEVLCKNCQGHLGHVFPDGPEPTGLRYCINSASLTFKEPPYTPIVGTLGYVLSPDKKKVLLMHRNMRDDDQHLGKYNGLGGKMHTNEDVATCMKREIQEEAGIEATKIILKGTINWTGFGPNGEDWMGFIFRIDQFSGTPLKSCPEGTLEWIDIDKIHELPMWEGDPYFLPLVFDDDPRIFHGLMPYANDKPLSWNYVRI